MKAKKILQFLSNSLAGLFLTAGFFILFASIFATGLLDNLDVLESSMQEQFGLDFILEQMAKESQLTKQQIIDLCMKNPSQEGCSQINNPEMFSSQAIGEIEKQINPYKSLIEKFKPLMILFFILSLVFYFLGTFSIYASIFKISINTLISSCLGYVAFASLPGLLPNVIDQAVSMVSSDLPLELSANFKESLAIIIGDWLEIPIAELKTLFVYLIISSLVCSVAFYLLKKKQNKGKNK